MPRVSRSNFPQPLRGGQRRFCRSIARCVSRSNFPQPLRARTPTSHVHGNLTRQSIQLSSATARAGCSGPCHKGICDTVCEHLPTEGPLDRSQQQPHQRKLFPSRSLRRCEQPPGFRRHLASRIVKGQLDRPRQTYDVEVEDAICRSYVPIGRGGFYLLR